MLVEKADGTQESFKVAKLRSSLRHAGASKSEISSIIQNIEQILYDGIKTEEIYRKAFEMLRASEDPIAARYSLRRALFGLGPTGFPFEDFLARLFELEGYRTLTRAELRGKCAIHEVDIVAYKTDMCFMAEAKFHMRPGVKCDLQDVLYSYARFLDLKQQKVHERDTCGVLEGWIVTNTKFTRTAVEYASCVGLNLLSWSYPKGNTLQERIERANMYPVTALSSLNVRDKRTLLENGVVLCRDIIDNHELLYSAGISRKKSGHAIEEGARLCKNNALV